MTKKYRHGFYGLEKAFDMVDHDILAKNLYLYGV